MQKLVIPVMIVTCLAGAELVLPTSARQLVARAESAQRDQLLPPRVVRVATRATQLYWGMPEAELQRIMGVAADTAAYEDSGGKVGVLRYRLEPIPTKITISDGKVSGVALDIAGIDERALPTYGRSAWRGMHRTAVLRMMGTPAEDSFHDTFGMKLEHMIFERSGQADLSIFLINERVVAKKVGRALPLDILSFALPLTQDGAGEAIDASEGEPGSEQIRVGMKVRDVQAPFGPPKFLVPYTFKGRPAEYGVYEIGKGGSAGCFTFIDDVLVEFASLGSLPLDQILSAG